MSVGSGKINNTNYLFIYIFLFMLTKIGTYNNNGLLTPLSVKVGDLVVLPEYGGSKINLKDGDFFVYRDTDIIGVLKKD